jgi:hypothetical protein
MEKPYRDLEVTDEYIIREFGSDIDPIELMWHRDNEDRMVEVLECGEGWGFQFDDGLPFDLEPNTSIFILRHDWHRVVKGEGTLLLKIHKT